MGSARTGFQGRMRMGFDRPTAASPPSTFTSCRRTARTAGFPDWPSSRRDRLDPLSAASDALPRHVRA